MPRLSVILCTHNPKPAYLQQTLDGLARQTLAADEWELILIDNASAPPVDPTVFAHLPAKVHLVLEPELGLTPARRTGINQSSGDLLVLVDDDNILDPDYLEEALNLAQNFPQIGAWGGRIDPQFEEPPPEWTKPYWDWLAIKPVERDIWGNLPQGGFFVPVGAGMCVRRAVALAYLEQLRTSPLATSLDRVGQALTGAGDLHLAMTAIDLAYGCGLFARLKMTHILPPRRLTETYLLKLIEDCEYSGLIFRHLRGEVFTTPRPNPLRRQLGRLRRLFFMPTRERKFFEAKQRGWRRALDLLSRQYTS